MLRQARGGRVKVVESVVTRRTAAQRRIDREAADCIDFDTALHAYRHGGNPEALLRAAGKVIDSSLALAPEHADTISLLTDQLDIEIETYSDAAHAIRSWWFALMEEHGARH
jgi:hypothetical protein